MVTVAKLLRVFFCNQVTVGSTALLSHVYVHLVNKFREPWCKYSKSHFAAKSSRSDILALNPSAQHSEPDRQQRSDYHRSARLDPA